MTIAREYYQVPGPTGADGSDGSAGSDGADAYSVTTANFTMPAEGGTVTIAVSDSTWAAIGMATFIEGAGTFEVTAKPSATQLTIYNLENTATGRYTANTAPATVIGSGKRVTPCGHMGPNGAAGTGGADEDAAYLVWRALDAPTNAFNLGGLTTGLLKITVSAGSAFPSTAVAGTDYIATVGTIATQNANSVTISGGSITGITDLAVADGGTGASTAGDARTNLGLGTIATQAANSVSISGGSITGITDLAVADGGTGASTAAGARSNLGVSRAPVDLIVVEEQQTAGTDGGTFTAGAYETRQLNTEVVDTGSHCSLAANQITLAAGTYRVRAWATAHEVNNHKIRFRNITAGTTVAVGSSVESAAADDTNSTSHLAGRFTIANSTVFELQHRCETTKATTGRGEGFDLGEVEVYSQVVLEREAD